MVFVVDVGTGFEGGAGRQWICLVSGLRTRAVKQGWFLSRRLNYIPDVQMHPHSRTHAHAQSQCLSRTRVSQ